MSRRKKPRAAGPRPSTGDPRTRPSPAAGAPPRTGTPAGWPPPDVLVPDAFLRAPIAPTHGPRHPDTLLPAPARFPVAPSFRPKTIDQAAPGTGPFTRSPTGTYAPNRRPAPIQQTANTAGTHLPLAEPGSGTASPDPRAAALAKDRGKDGLRPPRLARGSGLHPVEVSSFTCLGLETVDPQSLAITYWFDAAPEGDPYPMHVDVAGRLRGTPPEGGSDSFAVIGNVTRVVPGSGRVALTVRVPDLATGTWDVTATPVRPSPPGAPFAWVPLNDLRRRSGTASGVTTFTPLVRVQAPGVRPGAWPALVGSGAVLALAVQTLLASRVGLNAHHLLPLSVLACVLGVAGAKGYYLATHRSEPFSLLTMGMSVQGFVLAAIGALIVGGAALDLPLGVILDVTAPSLLFGQAVGRLGCLLGGCCVGRATASRWGIWSSDRTVGVRRIPVQLLESALAAVLAVASLLADLALGITPGGMVFVAAVAAYIAGRQLLFPLRDQPRATRNGRHITLALATLVALTTIAAISAS